MEEPITARPSVQFVCQRCGYNMVGHRPESCPFCGAPQTKFLTWEENSARHHVEALRVNTRVIRLNSVPQLGIEHAAYRVEADGKSFWVDCPSTFDRSLPSVDAITFTHHHFLGASNQYRALFTAEVAIHKTDSRHEICWGFPFDRTFTADFTDRGLEAVHLAGHTPGFTAYLFDDTLFVCDYVLFGREKAFLNPYGPQQETAEGLRYLLDLMNERDLRTVCGVDYVMDFPDWRDRAAPLAR